MRDEKGLMNMKSHSSVQPSPNDMSDEEVITCPAQPDPVFLSNLHGDGFASAYEQYWDDKAMAEMLAMTGVFVHQFSGGFIMTQISFETAEILTFAVLPGQRGKGYGAALLKAAMLHAFNKGATRMLLRLPRIVKPLCSYIVVPDLNLQVFGKIIMRVLKVKEMLF